MNLLALAIVTLLPFDGTLGERVDVIEVNNFYSVDDCGARHNFTQIIFREWNGETHAIIAWRMMQPVARELTEAERNEATINRWQVDQGREPFPFACPPKYSATRLPPIAPRFDHGRSVWVCEWLDGDKHRRVESRTMLETFTEFDPEVTERESLPKDMRRELRGK